MHAVSPWSAAFRGDALPLCTDNAPTYTVSIISLQSDSDRQSNPHESEYDTASDSPSDDDLQSGEYDEDIHSSDDDAEEEDLNSDLGEEEEEGGEPAAEGEEGEEKKKVDDDEDRSNPQYIPKKGTFYEHDDRTADNP